VNRSSPTVRYRWLIIGITLLLTLWAAAGLRHLAFNPDSRVFFSEENPQLIAFEELEDTFNRHENIYIALRPREGDVFTRRTLHVIEQLTEAAWQIPYSSRVDSITNFQHMRVDGDDLSVNDLVHNALEMSDAELTEIRSIALGEHALVHHLINPRGDMAGINANVIRPGESLDEVPAIEGYARRMLDDFRERFPDHEFFVSGSVAFDQAFSRVSQDDSMSLVPLMYLIIIGGIGLLLRSWSAMLVTSLIIGCSTLIAMGAMGYLGWILTSPTAVAPIIIMTLAVADSVHILSTLFAEMRAGMDRYTAIRESLRINMKPVFITSLTTAIGFLSLNASDVPPFRELGNIVAIGVFAAFVLSVLLLPALMAVLPLRVRPGDGELHPVSRGFAAWIIQWRVRILSAMTLLIVLIALGVTRLAEMRGLSPCCPATASTRLKCMT
jgi:predicted RND superfamily exporter protein